MKTLQNNFTTVEQSKRLLELGVPADSADCYWRNYGDTEHRADVRFVLNGYDKIHTIKDCYEQNNEIIPCWSVGRLMEIYCILNNIDDYLKVPLDWYHNFTDVFFDLLKLGKYDFSKLEE